MQPDRAMSTTHTNHQHRVALIAGGLSQGGAEKQLLYMAQALQRRGVEVRCFCLTRGDFFEEAFGRSGIPVVWIGRFQTPVVRLARLIALLRGFAPQVVQAGHFFVNLYAALGARACGAVSIGAIRNDGAFELAENRGWGPWLMRLPTLVVANSGVGARYAQAHGRERDDVIVIPNVIDLHAFDNVTTTVNLRDGRRGPIVIAVGRLVPAKRFDRFLQALVIARRTVPSLSGVIVGDGPQRSALEEQAAHLGLATDSLRFLGRRDDIPALLRQADMLLACSDHEGFPNVLLEAMAVGLPSITTPAGDAASVVLPNVTGVVVEPDNIQQLASAMTRFAMMTPARRAAMSRAARQRVERVYRPDGLADSLLAAYEQAGGRVRTGQLAITADGRDARLETRP